MNSVESAGALAFRLRGGIWAVFFLFVLMLADPAGAKVFPGLIMVVAGQLIRFWAAGSITSYRGEKVGAEKLVTWGPYAFARNPLYIGNALIGAGWSILAGDLWAFVLFAGVFLILYILLVIPYEESFLERSFPEEFARYSSRVGRFFPNSIPSAGNITGPFETGILWRSERHSLWVTIIGTILILSKRWW